MVRRQFYINGKPSSDFGIYAASDTYLNAPAVGYDSFSVPKVNGLFISEKDRLSNVTRRFTCFAPDGIKTACEALFQYLYSIDGYFVLQSDYDTSHYCYAYFDEGVEVTPFRTKAGMLDLYFSCMPQKYMATGIGTYRGREGNNLIDIDQLVGKSAYLAVGSDDDLVLMFATSSDSWSASARIIPPEGATKFLITADTSFGFRPTVSPDIVGSGSIYMVNQTTDTQVKVTIDTQGDTLTSIGIHGTSDGTAWIKNVMLQVKSTQDLPYEPYETIPPDDKWLYQVNTTTAKILPTFMISGLETLIKSNPGKFPANDFWYDWTGESSFVCAINTESFFNATVLGGGALVTTTDYDDVYSPSGATLCVTTPFEGVCYRSGTEIFDLTMTDISNAQAVGGDALYRITANVGSSTQNISIMVNDALIFVDLTGVLTSTNPTVSVIVDSKSYDCVISENGNVISGNSRATIYGDISLRSSNDVIVAGTVSSIVNAGVEVEWWTV